MSNNQPLTSTDRNELFESIRKQDVNALRSFEYHDSTDIIETIKYWRSRASEPKVAKNKQQRDLISLEIIRLESLMLARTEFTFSSFRIAEDGIIQQNAEIMSIDLFESIKPTTGEEIVDLVKDLANKADAKTIDMFPDKITLIELRERCRALLVAGKGDEAFALATRYLSVGNYKPDKSTKGKVEKFHEGRVKSWIIDLTKSIKKPQDQAAVIPDVTKNAVTLPEKATIALTPAAEKTAEPVASTSKEKEVVDQKTDKEVIVDAVATTVRKGDVEIFLKNKEAFMGWITATDKKLADWFEPELLVDDKFFDEFDSIAVSTDDVDALVEELTEVYKLDAREALPEGDTETFENTEISLTEEITHIETFLSQVHKLRGHDPKKPENLDKIKELCDSFFETRDDEDYEEQDKVFNAIKDHPESLKDVKSFFNIVSFPQPTIFVAKDSEGKSTTDNYNAVVKEIEAELKAAKRKVGKDRERELAKLEDKWVNQLRGQILASKETRADKTVYIANKITFYTKYHVYHFIDQINTEEITSSAVSTQSPASDKSKDTEKHDKVEPKKEEKVITKDETKKEEPKKEESKKPAEEVTPKVHVCTTIEEALSLVVSNGGTEADAYTHPFCESLKGTTISDPTGVYTMVLDDVNYKNYINRKYDEALALYKANLTTYPIEEMATLISQAAMEGQSPEDFVKDNISLITKEDGSFLDITGKLGDVDSTVAIDSKETFLAWVTEMFELEEKLAENAEPVKVYEVSTTIKSYKDFENQLKAKASEEKMPLVELQKWAREVACDKVFGTDNHSTPYWFSDEDRVGYLDSYVTALTKLLYETPESKIKQENELKAYIVSQLKGNTQMLFGFLSDIRKYCQDKSLDYNMKSLKAIIVSLAETHNKPMLDAYLKLKSSAKDMDTTPVKQDDKSTKKEEEKPKEQNQPIVDNNTTKVVDTNKLVAEIFKETKDTKDKATLASILVKYKDNPSAVLRTAIHLIMSNKQITDLKLKNEGEINTWVYEILGKTAPESSSVKETEKKTTPTSSVEENLFVVLGQSERKTFRDNLDKLVENNEDSTEFRGKLIKALTEGTGSHVKIVAKQSLEEMNKMIKRAFERKEDRQKVV